MLKGKHIALSVSKNKLEWAYTSSETADLKASEQKEANTTQRKRSEEIIKLRLKSTKWKQKGLKRIKKKNL